ncbi:MAG: DUF790 family protein [Myxococcota bacterium]
MLTSDLLRVRVVKKDLKPQFIKVTAPRHLERADHLREMFQRALDEGWSRALISDAITEIEGLSTDHKLIKGLAKLLLDKCDFAARTLPMEDAPDPGTLRSRAFRLAAQKGPLARRPGPTARLTAKSVFMSLAAELGCTPQQVEDALYADLKEEQILVAVKMPESGAALLHRYNVALIQAVLLRSSRITLALKGPSPRRLRQLFRYLKFHQLMYRMSTDADVVTIEVDGPQSLLKQSSRYGMQLAVFFPAILLQDRPWTLSAEVLWGNKRKLRKQLTVDHSMGLQSHYRDRGAWKSPTEEWFEERYRQLNPSWTLGPGEPIDLGEQRVLIPDFTFRRRGRVAHMDIVGFWRKGYLEKRLQGTPSNVILAVSKRLSGEKAALPKALQAQVVAFAEIIPAKEVLARLEEVAEPLEEGEADPSPKEPVASNSEGEQAGLFE